MEDKRLKTEVVFAIAKVLQIKSLPENIKHCLLNLPISYSNGCTEVDEYELKWKTSKGNVCLKVKRFRFFELSVCPIWH